MKKNTGRKDYSIWFIAFLLITGVLILLYPPVSKYLAAKKQARIVSSYRDDIISMDEGLLAEEWAKARNYNDLLTGVITREPFLAGSGKSIPDQYYDTLNINGIMGAVRIPKINLDLPVYHGTSESTLQKGAGHLPKSSLPIGGLGSHSILTGHRALTTAKLFTDLDQLEHGDVFYLDILDQTLAYEVDQVIVIEPEDISLLHPVPGHDYVTLVTCTPYAINSHRLLVRGTRIPYAAEDEVTLIPSFSWCWLWILLLLIVTFILIFFYYKKHKKKSKPV